MSLFLWHLALKRLAINWKLMSSLLLGITLAATLLAGSAVYSFALDELGLRHALNKQDPQDLNLRILASYYLPTTNHYAALSQKVNAMVEGTVRPHLANIVRYGQSASFYFADWGQGDIEGLERPRAFFQYITQMEGHVELTEGRLPRPVNLEGRPGETSLTPRVEALMDLKGAKLLKVYPGAILTLNPTYGDEEQPLEVYVSGIIEAKAGDDGFWFAQDEMFTHRFSDWYTIPFFVPEQTLLQGLGAVYPERRASYTWQLLTDTGGITPANAQGVLRAVKVLDRRLATTLESGRLITKLDDVLDGYNLRLFFLRVPLLLLVSLMVAVILYSLALISSSVVQQQGPEIALLKSRGASTFTVLSIFAAEGALLASVAFLLALPLALLTVSLLGKTPAFFTLTGDSFLLTRLTPEAVYLALLGCSLAFLAILVPAAFAARHGLASYRARQARPATTPFFHRSYLDLLLLLLVGSLYWQLSRQESFVVQRLFGESSTDFLMLLTPALFLVGAGLLFFRLFPWLLKGATRLLEPLLGTAASLALKHLSREPLWYSSLAVLLMMVTGLGMFASSFGATLERSYQERAWYTTGSDFRLEGARLNRRGFSDPGFSFLSGQQGIKEYALAYRDSGAVLSAGLGATYNLLAIDPESLARVGWFRKDFGPPDLHGLATLLGPSYQIGQSGVALLAGAEKLSVMVSPATPRPELTLHARIADSQGNFFSYALGDLGFQGWRRLEADLRFPIGGGRLRGNQPEPVPPLTLHSLQLYSLAPTPTSREPGAVFLDEVQVAGPQLASPVLLEGFERPGNWRVLGETSVFVTDSLDISQAQATEGNSSGLFTWGSSDNLRTRGIRLGQREATLPVVATRGFASQTGLKVGDQAVVTIQGIPVEVRIQNIMTFFPTLEPKEPGTLIANLSDVLYVVNLSSAVYDVLPNEVWVTASDLSLARESLKATVRRGALTVQSLHDRQETLAGYKADPLIAAGWGGMLLLSFLAVAVAAISGFTLFAYLGARRKRSEFGLLRTLGLSGPQVTLLILLDYGVTILAGLLFGVVAGRQLGVSMLRFLEVTERGERVTPPFVMQVDWTTFGSTYTVLAFVFLLAILLIAWLMARLALHQALRLGDE